MAASVQTFFASAARTASANSAAITSAKRYDIAGFELLCTAASGTTPTLDVTIQESVDGANWYTVGTFAQLTAAGSEMIKDIKLNGQTLRAVATIAGTTPSFTFSCKAVLRKNR